MSTTLAALDIVFITIELTNGRIDQTYMHDNSASREDIETFAQTYFSVPKEEISSIRVNR